MPVKEVGGVEAGFKLQGTHGYAISVMAFAGAGARRGTIVLTATGHGTNVSYRAPATVTAEIVRADLGSLGEVNLVRTSSGPEKTRRTKCFGRGLTYEPATYDGTIEFVGENGYTQATRHRLSDIPPLLLATGGDFCGGSGSGEAIGAGEPGARLRGLSFSHGRTLSFQLNKNTPRAKTLISAELKERRGRIWIRRELGSRTAPASAFTFDRALRTARLKPPAPFSGLGTVHRTPSSVSPILTGDLKLLFPGRSISLTGRRVHVTLVHARYTRSNGPEAEIAFRGSETGP
jgi:hypothetical protein